MCSLLGASQYCCQWPGTGTRRRFVAKSQMRFLLAKILASSLVQSACAFRRLARGTHQISSKLAPRVTTVNELHNILERERSVNLAEGKYELSRSLILPRDISLVGSAGVVVTCAEFMQGPAFIQNCKSLRLVGLEIRNCTSALHTNVSLADTHLEKMKLYSLEHAVWFSPSAGKLVIQASEFSGNHKAIVVGARDAILTVKDSYFQFNQKTIDLKEPFATVAIRRCTLLNENTSIDVKGNSSKVTISNSTLQYNWRVVKVRSANVTVIVDLSNLSENNGVIHVKGNSSKVTISNSTLQYNWRVVEVRSANATVILDRSNLKENNGVIHGKGTAADANVSFGKTNFTRCQALTWYGDRLSLDVQHTSFDTPPLSVSRYTLVVYSGGRCTITVRNSTFDYISTAMKFYVGVLIASLDALLLRNAETGLVISEDSSRPARGEIVRIRNRTGAETPCPHLIGKKSYIIKNSLRRDDYYVDDCTSKLQQQDFEILRRENSYADGHEEQATSSVRVSHISVLGAHRGIIVEGASNVTFESIIVSEATFGVVARDHAQASFQNSAILGNTVGLNVLTYSVRVKLDASSQIFFNQKDIVQTVTTSGTPESLYWSNKPLIDKDEQLFGDQRAVLQREDPWILRAQFKRHLQCLSLLYLAAEVLSLGPFILQPKRAPTWKKVSKTIVLSSSIATLIWIGLSMYVVWMLLRFKEYTALDRVWIELSYFFWMCLRVLILSAVARAAMPRLRPHIQVLKEIHQQSEAAKQADRLLQSATDTELLKDLAKKHRELLVAWEAGASMQAQDLFLQMKANCQPAIAKITPFLRDVRVELQADQRSQALFSIPLVNASPFTKIPEYLDRTDDGQVAAWLSRRAAWMRSAFEHDLQRVMDCWADCNSVEDALTKQYITAEQASKLNSHDLEPDDYPLRPLPRSRATSQHKNGGLLMAPGVKEVARALVKGRNDYAGAGYVEKPGVVYVTDWLRATLYSRDGLSLALAYYILENVFRGIVKSKAKLGDEYLPDIQRIAILCIVNVQDDELGFCMPCEVQLIPQDLLILKDIQHLLYEITRAENPGEIVGHPTFNEFREKRT